MKSKVQRFVVILLLTLFVSCSKDDKTGSYNCVVSIDEALSLNETYIINLLNSASSAYPEISGLKQYVSGGVDVYRLVYKTKVKGESIDASGLVCIPSLPGEYPVLSFQNGTNTVDAYAPSNFAINTSFQMIEAMASMGFIVVMPDYPGFGASSSVPHPYLVAEPTSVAITDMFFALEEACNSGLLPGITFNDDYYLMGYSQGGWATMLLHKALELEFSSDFNLKGSVCGAGPYDINYLFQSMTGVSTYPIPAYIGYIINAYSAYSQFTNPVTDILNQPYASRLSSLFNGKQDIGVINSQLTTSVSSLFKPEFLAGFNTAPQYSSVREAMTRNSISAWHTVTPLFLLHGGSDSQVNPQVTEFFYTAMINAGTSDQVCRKEILPGLDHGDGVVPAMLKGFKFLREISSGN